MQELIGATRVVAVPDLEVWEAAIDLPLDEGGRLARLLSADEHRRANGYGADLLRNRFIARRGLLRSLLGAKTGVAPADVRLEAPTGGKPRLADSSGLRFNVASSEGTAVFAFSEVGEVGVDVERVRAFPEEPTASDHFTPAERVLLNAAQGARRREFFLALWTRKEACAKALGLGLLDSYGRFEVPWPAGAESRPADGGLKVTDFRVGSRFVGAVALANGPCETH